MGRQERERHSRLEVGGLVANHIRLAIELKLAHTRARRKIEAGKFYPDEARTEGVLVVVTPDSEVVNLVTADQQR